MSSIQQRRSTATDTRLAVVINAAANLNAQLLELNRLRDLVRNAQLSARKSPQLHRKRKRIPALKLGAAYVAASGSENRRSVFPA
jgi:hypothetical protein